MLYRQLAIALFFLPTLSACVSGSGGGGGGSAALVVLAGLVAAALRTR
jgi:hypothetical protein